MCRPAPGRSDIATQAASAYDSLSALLAAEGTTIDAVVAETVFFRDIRRDLNAVLAARERVLGAGDPSLRGPPVTVIEQTPIEDEARFEIALWALVPHACKAWNVREVRATPRCGCEACARTAARLVGLSDYTYLFTGNIHGRGGTILDEARDMFRAAEALLQAAGMTFRNVVRTWIQLRDIDRDYADLNRARREFFASRGIELRPSSTGVGGIPGAGQHALSMSLYAVQSKSPVTVEPMSTPRLSEAWEYGADFSRGLRVEEANKVALYVAGTASVDEAGRTVHAGDLDSQAERMLVNIASLLEAHGATFADVVSAVTYLRHAGDAQRLRAIFRHRGFGGFPLALVEAPLCRSDLLCETEVVSALPLNRNRSAPR